ncbi:multidrug resistance-associated protein 1-like isoform X1 [Ostrea edulis]|uniref:multidrug resistance-associated protein 1-like isoform X1 n=2 Tax=Ostrea edulis TaxID=37623 RepID=UPI0024AF471F|nr:multidrug resistance-associated protein 1-like isoform X1 [Ostrea edulis]
MAEDVNSSFPSGFCDSALWDNNQTWYTADPDLTPCFQKTVLLWIPCVYLLLLFPARVYSLSHTHKPSLGFTKLNVSKTILAVWIGAIAVLDIGRSVYSLVIGDSVPLVEFVSPLVLCLTMILCIFLIQYERRRAVYSSGFLLIFWLLLSVAGILMFQSTVRRALRMGISDVLAFTTFNLYFPAILVEFILAALIDGRQRLLEVSSSDKKKSPEEMASFLSKITFWWFTSMVIRGYKHALTIEDLWHLNHEDTCGVVVPHFEKYWEKEVERSIRKTQRMYVHSERRVEGEMMELNAVPREEDDLMEDQAESQYKVPARLLKALVSAYLPLALLTALYKLIYDIMQFVSPLLLKLLIKFTVNKSEYQWRGIFYSLLMFIMAMIQSFILHQYFHGCQLLGMRIRTSIICLVYRKMLRLSNTAKKSSTVGEIVNLMSVDAQRFMDLTTYVHTIWSAPFQIIVALYFLYRELGPSIFAGFGVMIVLIPVNAFIAKKSRDLQVKQMILKDGRIKMMNEVLNGIKVLKMYAWEPSFEEQILKLRRKELRVLRTMAFLNACVSFTWTTAPFLVSLVTFAVFVFSDPANNILDAEKAFVSLSLFNILRFPLTMLPQVISNIVQTSVSLNRLQKFLNNEELDKDAVQKDEESKYAVMIENGSFTWEKKSKTFNLKKITVKVPEGKLVAVVGSVGCGKSSFLSAILGDMEKVSGKVVVKGSVAYVAQQAWIQNSTLKDNILFGKMKSEPEYSDVISNCQLQTDLDILPAGDMTEIGEKGINLSGGQKQRVSVARAVYQNSDVYLLDDPLSAVDAHVGKHIFEKVIGPNGILQNKTRILVTHGLGFLPHVDLIVTLDNGEVSEIGSFQELMSHAGAFADFVRNYLTERLHDEEHADIAETEIKDIALEGNVVSLFGSVLRDEDRIKLERQLSDCSYENKLLSGQSSSEKINSSSDLSLRNRVVNTQSSSEKINSSSDLSLKKKVEENSVKSGASLAASADQKNSSELDHHVENEHETDRLIKEIEEKKKEDKLIEAEKVETGMVKFSVFWIYLKSVGAVLSSVTFMFMVLYNGASIYSNVWLSEWSNDPLITRNGTNNSVIKEVDIPQRNLRLGVFGALGILQGIFTIIATLALYIGNIHAGKTLHASLVKNILASPMMFFDTTPLGRILNRFSKDMDVLDTQIGRIYESWLSCLLKVISVPIVIGYSTPYFLLAFLPLAVLYVAIQRFYVATSRQLKRLESTLRSPIYSHFGESISGVATIRAYRQHDRFISESDRRVENNNKSHFPSIVSNRWLAIRLEFIGNSVVFFACLFAVLGRDTLTGGIVGLSITYALNVTQTLNWLVRMTTELETNIVAVERVKEYSEIPTEAPWKIEETKPESTWPLNGEIVFRNYCLRYREGLDLVLKDITCQIQPGEKIGLVGRTGAGKSSLSLGLFRIIEKAGGSILIDGVDIFKIGLHDLRSKLTIIPQEPVLFSGTLRMNLDPFDTYDDATIWRALEHAHLKSFVESLPDGLQHICTEGGDNLSVGQRQLVCLARALLRKTKVLILDEATSAVDLETDDLIQQTIRYEFTDCTILTIAHRLNTVMDYNRIMVLSAGSIVEFDSPGNLLNDKKSVFFGMASDAHLV